MTSKHFPRTVLLLAITSSLLIAAAPSLAQQGNAFISSRPGSADGAPVSASLPNAVSKGSIVLKDDDPLFPRESRTQTCEQIYGRATDEITYSGGPHLDLRFEIENGQFSAWQRESGSCIRHYDQKRDKQCPGRQSGFIKENRKYDVAEDETIRNDTGWQTLSQVCITNSAGDTTVRPINGDTYLVGTIGDNYWPTNYYTREFRTNIHDPKNIEQFMITEVGFDDQLYISVNGHWIWINSGIQTYFEPTQGVKGEWGRYYTRTNCPGDSGGGSGGVGYNDRTPGIFMRSYALYSPEMFGSARSFYAQEGDYWDGGGYRPPGSGCHTYQVWQNKWERSENWHFTINLNLLPYLRKGENVIRFDTAVVDVGEFWSYIKIKPRW